MRNYRNACIGGWLKNSFIDFPGTVSSVLFFSGCNLRCPYCHNPDLVTGCGTTVDFGDILAFAEKRRSLIEGFVLSGGEPTIHREAVADIVQQLRSLGMKIKLDTNGLAPDIIAKIDPDYCAMDCKTVPNRYGELGWKGGDAEKLLLESIAIVKEMEHRAEIRITAAAPFINDEVIEQLKPLLQGVTTIYLQPFVARKNHLNNNASLGCPIPIETIRTWRDNLAKVAGKCEIRGEGKG